VILPDAIEMSVGSELQSTRPGETYRGVRRKYAGQRPGGVVVFADAGSRVPCSEGPLAADHDVAVRSEDKIEGAQLGVVDEAGCAQSSSVVEHGGRVVALTRGTHA
jgi:hypothetical protein